MEMLDKHMDREENFRHFKHIKKNLNFFFDVLSSMNGGRKNPHDRCTCFLFSALNVL